MTINFLETTDSIFHLQVEVPGRLVTVSELYEAMDRTEDTRIMKDKQIQLSISNTGESDWLEREEYLSVAFDVSSVELCKHERKIKVYAFFKDDDYRSDGDRSDDDGSPYVLEIIAKYHEGQVLWGKYQSGTERLTIASIKFQKKRVPAILDDVLQELKHADLEKDADARQAVEINEKFNQILDAAFEGTGYEYLRQQDVEHVDTKSNDGIDSYDLKKWTFIVTLEE